MRKLVFSQLGKKIQVLFKCEFTPYQPIFSWETNVIQNVFGSNLYYFPLIFLIAKLWLPEISSIFLYALVLLRLYHPQKLITVGMLMEISKWICTFFFQVVLCETNFFIFSSNLINSCSIPTRTKIEYLRAGSLPLFKRRSWQRVFCN